MATFAATTGKWEVLLKCGDPSDCRGRRHVLDRHVCRMAGSACPTIAPWILLVGLWVSTDGNNPKATGRTDGLWAVDTEGEARATSKLFFRVPVGAELCGPLFTPDDETAFVAVQHPGDGGDDWERFGRPSYYEDLSTRWPDFNDAMPVRPAVVVYHQARAAARSRSKPLVL
jgi:secreted PhoX family phosphatase